MSEKNSAEKQPFVVLSGLNVNEHTEKKEGLTYLSWSWAWDEIKRHYPEASYTIWKNESGLPYVYDPLTGFMVYTSVTIEGVTHEMWLPVMDSKNKAMKATPYTYRTKYGEKTVEAATMFDINKSIMRCLVKNLAMFGLGLYIYAGEDLPADDTEQTAGKSKQESKPQEQNNQTDRIQEAQVRATLLKYINDHGFSQVQIDQLCKHYKISRISEISAADALGYIGFLRAKGAQI